ncbi:sorbosone dehydrogenase family protein [Stakelama sp. CBK3Z-3]|uniref:Sorbosone dehydrogenase family protein n=1 Tax=Stakelama flava TaxID=2860338 RepID=A0ABS6XNW0_9SPHN|nr:sorbosone dehydrogenase family protein [Stakelama flava]MBW4331899.1 sorbosone dehydrogenase family protein [Stakelama flava]
MRRHFFIISGIILLVLIGVGVWLFQPDIAKHPVNAVAGRVPALSAPQAEVVPTVDIAKAVGWPAGTKPTPAKGMKVQAFADKLDHPRWLYRLPNGDILVAETNSPPRDGGGITGWVMNKLMAKAGADVPSANRITLLRDSNGDGVADQRSVFLSGLNSPFGMELVGNDLYVADTDALLRFPYAEGETKITAKPEKIVDLPGGGDHWARNVLYNPKDDSLWVSVGSSTNIADNGMDAEKNRATILEVFPKKKTFRIWASGIRNANGMAINPVTKRLWAVVNERDMLGSDMPPDYLTQVDFAAFFGWPWGYWGGYEDRRVEPRRPDLMEYVMRPDYALGAHVAPLGLTFAADANLGSAFARGAFVGEHGSWNRKPVSGYKVVFVPFSSEGFPVDGAKPVDVLTGFLDAKGHARGRPVGVITGPRGGLLVADDVGNMIWRVSAAGAGGVAADQSASVSSSGK